MGAISSKSPLERRNTVARRSQRRTIHALKAKVDKAFQNIKRFKGVDEEDAAYKALQLQPQLRNIHDTTLNRIEESFKVLEEKLRENQEKARKKEQEIQEKAEKKKEKNKKEDDVASEDNDVEVKEIAEDHKEAEDLEKSTEKRKTVELKFVQIVPDEVTEADVHSERNNNLAKSPEETRKSILKMGVPVLPGAVMKEISFRSSSPLKSTAESDSGLVLESINRIIENLQAIEYQIADFVGKKNGTQYNRIKDKLDQYVGQLDLFKTTDEYALEQIKICKNYAGSCSNFLDEKATDDSMQDDVFLPANNEHRSIVNSPTSVSPPPVLTAPPPPQSPTLVNSSSLSPVEARMKLQRLSKTTAI
ncbi:hypothetical protein NQ318_004872 [Aromia moschata]|uniref:Uncharacterized protein n=1 Tax=Aromia moschata TaxID=1265417 RepID=A0AAV8Z1J7_9CUCU|nr:hypothetical protein NQ318_004872 [Aromia moschata]